MLEAPILLLLGAPAAEKPKTAVRPAMPQSAGEGLLSRGVENIEGGD